jgi:hypothetical protein
VKGLPKKAETGMMEWTTMKKTTDGRLRTRARRRKTTGNHEIVSIALTETWEGAAKKLRFLRSEGEIKTTAKILTETLWEDGERSETVDKATETVLRCSLHVATQYMYVCGRLAPSPG